MSRGALFVATGERCRSEALAAVRFLRASNVGCPVTVVTDDPSAFAGIEGVGAVALACPSFSFADKIAGCLASPYDRTVFLDADAFVAGDLGEVFSLLDRFDVAAAHAPGRSGARVHDYESESLPASFPQLNTGVVAFRRSPVVGRLLERWGEVFAASPHHRHDQPAFRQALYESGVALTVLPPEWNALAGGGYYAGAVRVLHSHGLDERSATAEIARLNAFTGPRVVTHTGEIVCERVPDPPPTVVAPAPPVPVAGPVYSVPSRADIPALADRLGLRGTAVEIGVKEGKYSATILERWTGRLLVSVDPWREAPSDEYVDIANVPQARQDAFLETTRARLAPFGARSAIWRMTGDEAAARIPDGSLDFVYLDARHDYASVRSDLEVWYPKVAPGGLLAGHDYLDGDLPEGVFGVRSAVDEFFGALGIPVGVTTNEPATFPSWIVRVGVRPVEDARHGGILVTARTARRLEAGVV